jgi:hypothetical protein
MKRWFKHIRCHCGNWGWFKSRRLNTAYHDDKLNYVICCDDCMQMMWEGYESMWEEYYASR